MKPIVLSDVLAVGEFPAFEHFEILAKAGFKSIINNQPDGEVDRFPRSEIVAAEAKRVGLACLYIPIVSRVPSVGELVAFAKAIKELPGPIYAFCYSGSRSAAAAAFLMTETSEVADIVGELEQAGFDIRSLAPWLQDERARHVTAAKNAKATDPAADALVHALAGPVLAQSLKDHALEPLAR